MLYPLTKYQSLHLSNGRYYDNIQRFFEKIKQECGQESIPSNLNTSKAAIVILEESKKLLRRNFISIKNIEGINKRCGIELVTDDLRSLTLTEADIVSYSQDIGGYSIIKGGNTLLFFGYISDAAAIKFDLQNRLEGKRYLIVKAENTAKSKSWAFEKLFKVVFSNQRDKTIVTRVLYPPACLESLQNFHDKEYVYKDDSFYVYDIEGYAYEGTSQLEIVFWHIHLQELRISMYVI